MKKLLQSLFVLVCFTVSVYAQERTITGTVTAQEDNLGLPGVSVRVKGTQLGTATGSDGKYSIRVSSGATLVFSSIGYTAKEVVVGSSNVVNVSLVADASQLAEVVVTGAYGTKQTSRSTSYSAQVVNAEQLNPVRQPNVNNALAGKVAGLQVRSQSAAALGRNTQVRLRGVTGFSTGMDVIYVVDGTILPNADDISIDDIEDVSVLQGAASAAQFGTQGANGAIVITTKKARKSSGLGVTFNVGATVDNAYVLPNYQNTYAGGAFGDLAQYNWRMGDPEEWKALDGKYYHDYSDDASWGPKMIGQEYIPWYAWYGGTQYSYKTAALTAQPDNARDYFNTGVNMNNGFTVSKASDDFSIRLSYTNQFTQGLIPTSSLAKNIFQVNTSYDLNKHFTVAANINYVSNRLRGEIDDAYSSQSSGSFNQWFHRDLDMNILKELRGLRTPGGVYASWNKANPTSYNPNATSDKAWYGANYWYNFFTYYDLINNVNQRDRLYGNLALTYKVNDDLRFTLTYRKQQNTTFVEQQYSSELLNSGNQTQGNNAKARGYYETSTSFSNRENLEFLATYSKKIQDFSIDANLGSDFFSSRTKSNGANTNMGLSVDNLYTIGNSVDPASISNGRTYEKYRALFGRAVVGYKNILFANVTLRNDWYSTLPADNNSILSKSFGGSFVFSDLLPQSTKSWLSEAKLRASYGEIPQALGTTSNTFGAYRYPGGLYGVSQFKFFSNIVMSTPDQFVDPQISGALTKQTEFGADFLFFNRRLEVSGTYWDGKDSNFPWELSVNGATGYSTILTNIGLIHKSGVDLKVGGTPIRSNNFSWNVNATWGRLISNTVEEISKKYNISRISVQGVWGSTLPYMIHQQGMKWGQVFGNGIKRNEDGVPILRADGMYERDNSVFFGSVLPKYTGGIQNNFRYKDFNLTANIDYQYGGKFVSLSNQWGSYSGLTARTAVLNDLGNPIRDAVADGGGIKVSGVNAAGEPTSNYINAQNYFQGLYNNLTFDDYIYDLTFIKLREVSLGYNIPVNKLGNLNKFVKNANISVVGRNLWLLYATTKDFDPSEISATVGETAQLPGTRGVGFNLRIGF